MLDKNSSPLESLVAGHWFKLICGASYQDLPTIRNLALTYTIVGADCIDVAADRAVIVAAKEGIETAAKIAGLPPNRRPWLMVSLNDGEDPHFRKAVFNPQLCPVDCPRPCEKICPAYAIDRGGVIEQRCYGCGRCLPVCPRQIIETKSRVCQPQEIIPLIIEMGVDAIEIHTQVGHGEEFARLWQAIAPVSKNLKILAISCQDHEYIIDYLHYLRETISPLSCPLIWQTDGRPMSGDIGKGTTHPAINMAKKVLCANLAGFVQLAGGTNDHTVTKLQQLGLREKIAGIAYGSYARSLILPILEHLDQPNLENDPQAHQEAVKAASILVAQLKA
ncbi:MAG: 4Fe-4S ferredoxin [Microcystis flos-aquae DF17]|nr:4Fe-4S ferredoxin [Microcystis sp. 53598_E5]REJ50362.1 MAG: 4Fe-4S ferredoxin [Microcystis flos-aquae DF17]